MTTIKYFTLATAVGTTPWWSEALSNMSVFAGQVAPVVGVVVGLLTVAKLIKDLRKP